MAIDEILLESAADRPSPVLRFYAWDKPAATFGYFQKYADIAAWTLCRPLIRRPTGGGLVPHDADWTYSLVFPPGYGWYELSAQESYERVHAWIQSAFHASGIPVSLATRCHHDLPGQCFSGAEKADVLWQQRKVAGAAQRRTRHGLLVQGSIQPPPGVTREAWERIFCQHATRLWNVAWEDWQLPVRLQTAAEQRATEKFSTKYYNERR